MWGKTVLGWVIIACLTCTSVIAVQAQVTSTGQKVHNIHFDNVSLADAVFQLGEVTDANVVFSSTQIPERTIDRTCSGTVAEILALLLDGSELKFRERDGNFIVFKEREEPKEFFISGYVEDKETGELLAGAHVISSDYTSGTVTNVYGHFTLAVPAPATDVKVSYLGYTTLQTSLVATGASVKLRLQPSLTLDEVVITSESRDRIDLGLNTDRVVPDRLQSSTALGGEFDLNQYAAESAGVTTGADGIGGLNIRGGSNDQNLVLMDGVPIYNPTHAIGILSIFNPNSIREAQIIKGGFSASYAGRLSSVLDVRTKDGNKKKWGLAAGLGPLSTNLLVEGPIVKDKVSILVAGRLFVPSEFLSRISRREKEANGLTGKTNYTFSDLNVKLSAQISKKDWIYASFYRGSDRYEDHTEQREFTDTSRILEEFDKVLDWGNTIGTLRWNHAFGQKVFSNLTFVASRFGLQSLDVNSISETIFDPRLTLEAFISREFKSTIEDIGVHWDFDHLATRKHRLKYGVSAIHHHFKPKSIAIDDLAQVGNFIFDEQTLDDALFADLFVKAWELGAYFEDRITFSRRFSADIGIRLSMFTDGEATYIDPQPRLSIKYLATDDLALEASASRMVQYLHLLTSSGIGLPTDLWVPTSGNIRPQRADQVTIGAIWNPTTALQFGWQLFYKEMDGLTEFAEGASFLLSQGSVEASIIDAAAWQDKVAQGTGRSYGSEWQVGVKEKRWGANANYTLSRADRTFEDLNFGETFPFRFDRRHSLALSGNYRVNKVMSVNASWNYGSGAPITLAESRFLYPGTAPTPRSVAVLEVGERNGYRLPAYHRLDLGFNATFRRPKAEHSINVSLYNVYSRRNLLYVTLIPDGNDETFSSAQFTVLPFLPSVSYQIKL